MRFKIVLGLLPFAMAALAAPAEAQRLTLDSVNQVEFGRGAAARNPALILKVQVLLDRARFSPGSIDAAYGENVRQAIAAYKKAKSLDGSDQIDQALWDSLTQADSEDVLTTYTITRDDVNGPFVAEIPDELERQADLDKLSYSDPRELLGEKFHMDPKLLERLNPDADFTKEGTEIVVVKPREGRLQRAVATIEVDKAEREVRALSREGEILAVYPATIGSRERPAPEGTFEIRAVATNPNYTYNPEFDWRGVKTDKPFVINPGPNNPVGTVWMAIDREGYGLHGSPDPETIGKVASHGCVRMTNWDGTDLANAVKRGTKVVFIGTESDRGRARDREPEADRPNRERDRRS